MVIGERLRRLRERRRLTQGDIEQRTGLMKCYISRVENGHTVPSLENLERFAAAFDLPLYQLFYSGEQDADTAEIGAQGDLRVPAKTGRNSEEHFILKLGDLLDRIPKHGRDLLLVLARKMAIR